VPGASSGRRLLTWSLVPVGAALAAWEGTLERFSVPSEASVGAVILLLSATAILTGRSRQRAPSARWVRDAVDWAVRAVGPRGARPAGRAVLGVVGWTVLIAATIGWDLHSFVAQAHSLPTLSRLFGDVTRHGWGRGAMFAVWLGLGTYLSVGWRRTRSTPGAPAGCLDRPDGRGRPPT
jgi:hypothetical protein